MNSNKRAAKGRVRIIGGAMRSRQIEVPDRPGLRPTPDRVRETLFNWLGQEMDGRVCLDLFAGSGALGFEAASRGAERVVMVDSDHAAAKALQANRDRLYAMKVEVVQSGALQFLAGASGHFDVVFLDPPFRQNLLPEVLARLPERLAKDARVYIEAPAPVEAQGWTELRRGRAGQVSFQLMTWSKA